MGITFDNTYARLPEAFFHAVEPAPVASPKLIRVNLELAERLGIPEAWLRSEAGLSALSGNRIAEGSTPIAMAYSGHQFGSFNPQLGDGRALLLGETVGKDGVRYDVQLKGSGRTPFSRRGDGRSALGPTLREYIVSEAMAAMGVPTTRALAVVASGESVMREEVRAGGVFTRIARSHIRIGTFEWFAARQDQDNLKVLADYVIERLYPEISESDNPYLGLLEAVSDLQAELVAQWMSLGFIHGVMNTDNMNISGETIDYGPCAFLDEYHPGKKFSSIDHGGRYAFANQGRIAQWNLARFAETLLPLIHSESERAVALAGEVLERFSQRHQAALRRRFVGKIGLDEVSDETWAIVQALLDHMAEREADFTLVFRGLTAALSDGAPPSTLDTMDAGFVESWWASWTPEIQRIGDTSALERMRDANPIYIPRNHRVEAAIEAAYQGDFGLFHELCEVVAQPYSERSRFANYERAPSPAERVQATFCGT